MQSFIRLLCVNSQLPRHIQYMYMLIPTAALMQPASEITATNTLDLRPTDCAIGALHAN